jgi:hypothetical protein
MPIQELYVVKNTCTLRRFRNITTFRLQHGASYYTGSTTVICQYVPVYCTLFRLLHNTDLYIVLYGKLDHVSTIQSNTVCCEPGRIDL